MTVGLILTALGLGLRHGIDWDHIAAIADLSSTAATRRRGFLLSLIYALGHAVVVLALGALAIAFSTSIPESVDTWMGRIVGVTLVALGAWVLIELVRKGRDFRLRSRAMLVVGGTFAGMRRVRGRDRRIAIEHDHAHEHVDDDHLATHAHDHAHVVDVAPVPVGGASTPFWRAGREHHHRHRHDLALPAAAPGSYGGGTAAGIGVLHGIGVESPTQIAVFVASTSVAGTGVGLVLLVSWVTGLLIANTGLALLAGAGILRAERNFALYATLAVIVGLGSVAMGGFLLL